MYLYFLIALAPLCWAGDIVLAKGIANCMSPFGLVFWRWFVASLLLFPFTNFDFKKDYPVIKENFIDLWMLSCLGMSVFISLLYIGVRSTTVINSALIQTTIPALIVVAGLFFYGERVTKKQIFGISLCILGAVYVVLQGSWHNLVHLSLAKGDVLIFLASLLYGLYCVLLRRSPPIAPVKFLFVTSFLGAITILPFFIWEIIVVGHFQLNMMNLSSIMYVAVCPSIVAYLCWNQGIKEIGAANTGLFMNLTPVFAAVLSILFLGEHLRTFHVIGMSLVFFGMLIFNNQGQKNVAEVKHGTP